MRAALRREAHVNITALHPRKSCKCLKRTCAARRREPHIENHPRSIRKAAANLSLRAINGEEVSGESPDPPDRRVSGCAMVELFLRKMDGRGGGGGVG
eukprot:9480369-Pyramimonas_sp.AAC.1